MNRWLNVTSVPMKSGLLWGDLMYRTEAYDTFIRFGSERFQSWKSPWLKNNFFHQTSTSPQSIKTICFTMLDQKIRERSCREKMKTTAVYYF